MKEICLPLQGGLVLLNKQGVIIAVDANADNLRAAVWNNDTLIVTSTSFRKGSRFLNVRHFSDLNINDKSLKNVNFKWSWFKNRWKNSQIKKYHWTNDEHDTSSQRIKR